MVDSETSLTALGEVDISEHLSRLRRRSVNLGFDSAGFLDPEQACRTLLAPMLEMKPSNLGPSI
jgi:hypothetical protein